MAPRHPGRFWLERGMARCQALFAESGVHVSSEKGNDGGATGAFGGPVSLRQLVPAGACVYEGFRSLHRRRFQ